MAGFQLSINGRFWVSTEARHGKPKARLVPLSPTKKAYVHGAGKGKWKGIGAILDQPLPEDVLDAFYRESRSPEKES
jgi:antitoxin (DNA-binding transcriptional repressor) of toxin-antitoxin stability system